MFNIYLAWTNVTHRYILNVHTSLHYVICKNTSIVENILILRVSKHFFQLYNKKIFLIRNKRTDGQHILLVVLSYLLLCLPEQVYLCVEIHRLKVFTNPFFFEFPGAIIELCDEIQFLFGSNNSDIETREQRSVATLPTKKAYIFTGCDLIDSLLRVCLKMCTAFLSHSSYGFS